MLQPNRLTKSQNDIVDMINDLVENGTPEQLVDIEKILGDTEMYEDCTPFQWNALSNLFKITL